VEAPQEGQDHPGIGRECYPFPGNDPEKTSGIVLIGSSYVFTFSASGRMPDTKGIEWYEFL